MNNLRHLCGAQRLIPPLIQKVAGLCAGLSFIQKGEEKKCAN